MTPCVRSPPEHSHPISKQTPTSTTSVVRDHTHLTAIHVVPLGQGCEFPPHTPYLFTRCGSQTTRAPTHNLPRKTGTSIPVSPKPGSWCPDPSVEYPDKPEEVFPFHTGLTITEVDDPPRQAPTPIAVQQSRYSPWKLRGALEDHLTLLGPFREHGDKPATVLPSQAWSQSRTAVNDSTLAPACYLPPST